MGTLMGSSMTRVNSVSNVLKRIFNREDSRTDGQQPQIISLQQPRLPGSASTASLKGDKGIGSMRIADQVIEEVDEQLTITSMRPNEHRPHAASIFASPPPSNPIPVPKSGNSRIRHFSSSAPDDPTELDDTISIGSASTTKSENEDDFMKLKAAREMERRDRLMQKLTKSISMVKVSENDDADTESLLASQLSIAKESNM